MWFSRSLINYNDHCYCFMKKVFIFKEDTFDYFRYCELSGEYEIAKTRKYERLIRVKEMR